MTSVTQCEKSRSLQHIPPAVGGLCGGRPGPARGACEGKLGFSAHPGAGGLGGGRPGPARDASEGKPGLCSPWGGWFVWGAAWTST